MFARAYHRHGNASQAARPVSMAREAECPHYSASHVSPVPRERRGARAGDLSPTIALDSLVWCLGLRSWSDFTV